MNDLLKRLSEAPGISGFENDIVNMIKKEIKPHVDEIKIDKIGNLIAKKGKGSPKIMLVAHMDKIGFMIKYIDNDGFIRFETVGGWDPRNLPAKKVMIHGSKGPVVGVIGVKAVHLQEREERKKVAEQKELFIDVGASKAKDVEKLGISVGDCVTIYSTFANLAGSRVSGPGLDNRIGCYELIEIAKKIKQFKGTVYFVATVQEEIGLIGMRGSTFGIDPDVILGFDTTVTGDTPGVGPQESPIALSKGPVIDLKDAAGITSLTVKKWLLESAKNLKIKTQFGIFSGGATDSSIGPMIREGIPSGGLSTPTRYLHTPIEVADMKDVDGVIKVGVSAIENAHKYF